jgi:prevent-host-death family protein
MVEVATRELRNDTAGVLRRVEAGETVVITVRGKAVADLVPHRAAEDAPRWLSPADVMDIRAIADGDPTWGADLAKLRDETTEDLGPIL